MGKSVKYDYLEKCYNDIAYVGFTYTAFKPLSCHDFDLPKLFQG